MSGKLLIDSAFQNETRVAVVDEKNNVLKFELKEPSLEEIFISKVGETYGK